jgi:H+-transporting ATPase
LVGVSPEQLLEDAALASRAEDEDPIDLAVLGGSNQDRAQVEVIHFQRFDPVSERTEATVRAGDRVFRVTKGAPQVILKLASNADQVRSEVESAVNDFTSRGFRTLGVARTNGRKEWEFLGILPLFDPPREDSRQVIRAAEDLGIQVKMVTGDQVAIAREISRRLNLGTRILDAERLDVNEPGAETALASAIENSDGFAQVYPEHKDQIVDVLQQHGHTVGMTGEGANDAPALKKADAGIAVSGATDAARDASDIVLTSPGLSVIVDAIRESRHIVQRMNAYAIYRITETIRLLVFMTLSILVFNFYPVTAAMIVLLALLNEGPILAIAYDFVRPSPKPEKWNMPLALGVSTVLGLAGVAASFGLLYIAEHLFNLPSGVIQTLMFLKLAIAGQLTIFITRTRGPFWSLRPSPVLLWLAVGTKVLATLAAVYGILMPAIGWNWAVIIWAYAFAWFFINDGIKIATYRLLEQHPPTIWGGQTAGYPQPEARHV